MRTTQQVWIRGADPEDLERVRRLLEVHGEREGQEPVARAEGLAPERLIVAEVHQAQLPQARLALADEAGCCIVGAARLEPLPGGSVELAEVVVDPRCRRAGNEGLASALAEAASERTTGPAERAPPAPRAEP